MRTVLLVHSPLLGPSSWRAFANAARRSALAVAAPDLRPAFSEDGQWSSAVASACADACPATGEALVVGHSGAGNYLPAIADAIGMERASFAFVDAVLPPPGGSITPGVGIRDLLAQHTSGDGWLDPWFDWWPDDVIEGMVPDQSDRRSLRHDVQRLRRAVYDEAIPVPEGWQERPIRYVQTSPAYATESDVARTRGWDLVRMNGTHLSIVTHPYEVLDHVLAR